MRRIASSIALSLALLSAPALANETEADEVIFVSDDQCDPELANCPGLKDDESPLSGDVSVLHRYVDRDGLVLANKPVVQASLSLEIGSGIAINTWHSYSPFTKVGGESDVGVSYTTSLAAGELTLSADRYLLTGLRDITAVGASFTQDKFDLSVKQYFWDNNPDATRVEVGYTIEPMKRVTLRPAIVVEDGFGLGTRVLAAADASYALTDTLSLTGSVYVPLKGNGINTVTASFGLSFSF